MDYITLISERMVLTYPTDNYESKSPSGGVATLHPRLFTDLSSGHIPFGLPFADAGKGADLQPYKFGGKELDAMYGLHTYDFHARTLIPDLCRFDRPDQLAEKYPHLSPYLFCANDPVNNSDPTEMDIWDIDQWGNILNRTENKDMDQFRLVNRDGRQRKDEDGNDLTLEFDVTY